MELWEEGVGITFYGAVTGGVCIRQTIHQGWKQDAAYQMTNSVDEFTIVKAKCATECILGLIDCLEIQKDQTGLDDDWKVSFILTICCGWTQVKWRTKLFHNSDSSWLERVLDTQAQ